MLPSFTNQKPLNANLSIDSVIFIGNTVKNANQQRARLADVGSGARLSRDRANRKQPTLSFKPETISTGATRHIHQPPIPFSIPSSLPGIPWACGRSYTPLKTRYYT